MNKQCTRCKDNLPLNMFARRKKESPVLTSHCRKCRAVITKQWQVRKREDSKIVEKSYVFDQLSKYVQRWYA